MSWVRFFLWMWNVAALWWFIIYETIPSPKLSNSYCLPLAFCPFLGHSILILDSVTLKGNFTGTKCLCTPSNISNRGAYNCSSPFLWITHPSAVAPRKLDNLRPSFPYFGTSFEIHGCSYVPTSYADPMTRLLFLRCPTLWLPFALSVHQKILQFRAQMHFYCWLLISAMGRYCVKFFSSHFFNMFFSFSSFRSIFQQLYIFSGFCLMISLIHEVHRQETPNSEGGRK